MADNFFSILIRAVLDGKSLPEINKQIENLGKQAADMKLGVKIDKSDIKRLRSEVAEIQKELNDDNLTTKQRSALLTELNQKQKTLNALSRAHKQQSDADLASQKSALSQVASAQRDIVSLRKSQSQLAKLESAETEKVNSKIREQKSLLSSMKTWRSKQTDSTMGKTGLFGSESGDVRTAQVVYDQLFSSIKKGEIEVADARLQFQLLKDELIQIGDLSSQLKSIKFSVDSGNGSSDYGNRIEKLKQDFERYGISADEASKKTEKLRGLLSGFKSNGNWLPDEQLVAQADRIEQEFKSVKVAVDQAKLAYDKFNQPVSNDKAASLINRINNFLYKNTAITSDAKEKLQGFVRTLEQGATLNKWNEINGEFKKIESNMRGLGKLGASFKNQMKQAAESFTQWVSVSSAIMLLITKTKQAVTELKEVDTLLTEISKANDNLSKSQLAGIGNRSFETASRYGKKATDYLAGVQEMSRAGYQDAEAMGELSVKAQGAGDMTEEVANKFIVATDKAYKLGGSITELTRIMDGINYITNHNAINMTELSEGFSIVGSTAASFGVEANELTAALATMGASTQQSGSEVARAFRAILLNIRQVSDEEEGIDAEGLTKYEEACNDLNVKLKETKNGVQELRNPMEVLRELSNEYKKLSDTDIRKVNLLNAVGGKVYHVIQKCITRMNLIAGNPLEPCTTI